MVVLALGLDMLQVGGEDSGVCLSSKADGLNLLCSLCSTNDVSMTYSVTLAPDLNRSNFVKGVRDPVSSPS